MSLASVAEAETDIRLRVHQDKYLTVPRPCRLVVVNVEDESLDRTTQVGSPTHKRELAKWQAELFTGEDLRWS